MITLMLQILNNIPVQQNLQVFHIEEINPAVYLILPQILTEHRIHALKWLT